MRYEYLAAVTSVYQEFDETLEPRRWGSLEHLDMAWNYDTIERRTS